MTTPPKPPCAPDSKRVAPVVDRNRCEGKADCVRVCPHDVFVIARIGDADFTQLTLLGKVKSVVHGKKTAYTPKADDCHACGLCVDACPEKAIHLEKVA